MDLIRPRTERTGRDAHFDLTMQIANTLKQMEENYFSAHPDRQP
jgi:hypothetical protein